MQIAFQVGTYAFGFACLVCFAVLVVHLFESDQRSWIYGLLLGVPVAGAVSYVVIGPLGLGYFLTVGAVVAYIKGWLDFGLRTLMVAWSISYVGVVLCYYAWTNWEKLESYFSL